MTESKHPAVTDDGEGPAKDFIRIKVKNDLGSGRLAQGSLQTRFPPEPNGYLHLGHAKSICLNFGLAEEFGGRCNLRFDDTNPLKESREYVDAIREDVRWLGFDWEDREYYASDYFERLYALAEKLIGLDRAYVDSQTAGEIQRNRGTLTRPGLDSPFRGRSAGENLDLFRRMKAGEFPDGAHVLRAKIDMASPNILMRDPTLYRIRHAEHHRTGNRWCIYPMYDFTHCISDSLEKVTPSLCTLECANNRELYDWILETLGLFRSRQTEFARLSITRTILSKRKLIQLVAEGYVSGWDDPRMPTLSGLRRRGVPPEAIREFCARIGVARADNIVDYALFEFCIREVLNATAERAMAVLDPLKVVIENYPEERTEWFSLPFFPDEPEKGARSLPFSRELWIERADFREDPPAKFFRLAPGREVRLRCAYYITCKEIRRDQSGRIESLICVYDPQSRGGGTPDNRKVRGTLHWISATHAVPAAVRLYGPLFLQDEPENAPEGKTFLDALNPDSLQTVSARIAADIAALPPGERLQFERLGYFCVDPESTPANPVFNRIVTLKDAWARLESKRG
jgi:glutaminyl-tRNA synthetase